MGVGGALRGLRRNLRDSPTGLYAIATRLATAGFAFLNGVLVVALLSPERVGIFLSFLSLAAFSGIADLGMSMSLLLAAATHSDVEANRIGRAAMQTATPFIVTSGFILFFAGNLFFRSAGSQVHWLPPWALYCALSSLQQWLILLVTHAEGSGRRHAAWRANLTFEVVAGVLALGLIAGRHELWALPAACAARILLIGLLFPDQLTLLRWPARPFGSSWGLWRRELWPMQWQTLLNTVAGLITTRLMTPVLLRTEGPAEAGRIGLVLSLVTVASGATVAWPLSQTSLYAALYDAKDYTGFRRAFGRVLVLSTALAVVATLGSGVVLILLRLWNANLADHLPPAAVMWPILAAIPATHLSGTLAIGLRSQRRDPVVIWNTVLAVPAMILMAVAARHGPEAFAITFICTSCVFLSFYVSYANTFMRSMKVASDQKAAIP